MARTARGDLHSVATNGSHDHALLETLLGLAWVVEARDPFTGGRPTPLGNEARPAISRRRSMRRSSSASFATPLR